VDHLHTVVLRLPFAPQRIRRVTMPTRRSATLRNPSLLGMAHWVHLRMFDVAGLSAALGCEVQRLDREEFLRATGFSRSRSYYLRLNGRLYDPDRVGRSRDWTPPNGHATHNHAPRSTSVRRGVATTRSVRAGIGVGCPTSLPVARPSPHSFGAESARIDFGRGDSLHGGRVPGNNVERKEIEVCAEVGWPQACLRC
jgi:hypothetical protein